MKVTELMIGDWVQNQDGSIKGKVINIDTYQNRVEFGAHTIDAGFVYPIPLTSEILEKNGFELDKELTEEDENKWYKHYFKDPLPNVNGVVSLYISFDEEDQNPELSYIQMVDSLSFKYVHQLQHILKDLQIEKEIII